ncbi:unnamed protein product [Penicillium salamii]|uniref:Rhodopsin domain-containing protein n=1 Tax=Penicillium salamii TaxID=1612424 RepID=A0A9W4NKX6_9EURO|nr:unnamed protein product [Penicillium salamii]CAG7992584.1 unnamed protein product [Penicillium salamii]CAG8270663.1 unnamed protein product [Penicillium salamii]CAG8355078.1 unnamed protein product [Penicillium salamii]CAG8358354.1 unnamed protein product [Penicillium salamii]
MSPSREVLLPPLLPVNAEDHGAWVIVVSTILLIITTLATTVTFISRIRVLRKLSWSDTVVFLSCSLFIPQTVCINVASFRGIGKHRHALTNTSFEVYSKTIFASQLLAVLVLSCSKAAVVLLAVLGMIAAWTLASLVALGTQCSQPRPWLSSPDRCVNQYALYTSLGAIHIVLDMSIIALPMTLLHQVQIIRWKRHQISALFAMRILVMALTIAGLRSLHPMFKSKPSDRPWHTVMPAIWLQLILSSSILCTCIPTLKRVLADLQTGMMAGTVSDFFEQSVSGHTNTGSQSVSKSSSGIGQRSASPSIPHTRFQRSSFGVERMDSQTILRDHAITQTIDYEVRYEGNPARVSSSSNYESDALSIHMVDPAGKR